MIYIELYLYLYCRKNQIKTKLYHKKVILVIVYTYYYIQL